MDTITVTGYGPSTDLDAAHVDWETDTACHIVARIPEPQARADYHAGTGDWDESRWRADVRAAVVDAGWDEPDSDEHVRISIHHDPCRDQEEEELILDQPARA